MCYGEPVETRIKFCSIVSSAAPCWLFQTLQSVYALAVFSHLQVILLFQRIEGVDICLFCLYMQEYGEDNADPNHRWVYLAYLDSIKFLRPENLEVAGKPGMAVRTLVYHQILISYLAYVKLRGFTSMFIWACPPLQVWVVAAVFGPLKGTFAV